MLSDRLRQWSRWLVEPIARALARAGITPNALTLSGFALNIINVYLLAVGRQQLAGALILLFTALDAFDGTLARITGRVTRFGGFLDSVLDRYTEAALFFGLLVFYAQAPHRAAIYLIYAALVGSLMVSYTRARAEGLGLCCQEGWFTRVERIIVLSLGLLLGQMRIALWVLAVLSNVTAVQRIVHVHRLTRGDRPTGPDGDARKPRSPSA
jgi:CDP-diacylglycerol--glycerol-3-phosphate 3-phosphatidyltransferase